MFEDKITALNQVTDQQPIPFEKRTYTVPEIQDILGIGKNSAYSLVKSGAFRTVRIGSVFPYNVAKLNAWLHKDGANRLEYGGIHYEQNKYVCQGNGQASRIRQDGFILACK